MLGFPLLYFKGMRLMMFQLSSFYCSALSLGQRSFGFELQGRPTMTHPCPLNSGLTVLNPKGPKDQ